jgi:putative N6-adenine-specific DNA methylase
MEKVRGGRSVVHEEESSLPGRQVFFVGFVPAAGGRDPEPVPHRPDPQKDDPDGEELVDGPLPPGAREGDEEHPHHRKRPPVPERPHHQRAPEGGEEEGGRRHHRPRQEEAQASLVRRAQGEGENPCRAGSHRRLHEEATGGMLDEARKGGRGRKLLPRLVPAGVRFAIAHSGRSHPPRRFARFRARRPAAPPPGPAPPPTVSAFMSATFRILAQVPPGLEGLLAAELAELGIRGQTRVGGIEWEGGWDDLLRANLHLRTASRVLVELGRFRARALGELERKAAELPWERVHAAAGPGAGIRLRVSASRSRLYHEGAIEERLRRAGGLPDAPPPRPEEDPAPEVPLLVVRVHRDEVTLRLDTSGAHLHRRGYRTHVGAAPLRETLAAALLLALPEAARTLPLLDPFAGSGTIAIEGALRARRIPPGLASADRAPRSYAFQAWEGFPEARWTALVEEARAGILPRAPAPILASDRDAQVLGAAEANLARAGVEADVSLAVAALSRAPLSRAPLSRAPLPDAPPGWVVTNPPYGTRLGDRRGLRSLYAALGRAFREEGRFAGWGLLLLSGDPVLEGATGLALEERFATSHGGLRVRAVAHPRVPAPGEVGG